ncbi:MAG: hypothetical protein JWN40_4790 [Phycisphaerales bacterium]|nr:hypothetical protein [Phycisphaerales bacterium]
MKSGLTILLLVLTIGSAAQAKSATPPAPQREAAPAAPVLPDNPQWVRPLLIGIAGLFIAAAFIGPLYRLNLPDELPPTHSHDEPPGSSHRHGPGGTIDFSAPDRH